MGIQCTDELRKRNAFRHVSLTLDWLDDTSFGAWDDVVDRWARARGTGEKESFDT